MGINKRNLIFCLAAARNVEFYPPTYSGSQKVRYALCPMPYALCPMPDST
jgi:hypothetical protein